MSRILETQNQIIIRFPQQAADILNAYFDGAEVDMPSLEIEMDRQRSRTANPRIALKVAVAGKQYKASVMELPTISSTFKTLDHINYFKSNDVSEMIVVHENEDDCENIFDDMAEKVRDRDGKIIKYRCESGLTTPTKYIRQSNFKDKPQIDRNIVHQVDKQMQSIRYYNSQTKQGEKLQAKKKKSMMNKEI